MKKQYIWSISVVWMLCVLCFIPQGVRAAGKKMSIQWKVNKKTVTVGKKLSLKVKIRQKKQGTKLVWKSSSKKIATVSKKGVVSGKKPGKVKITARIQGTKVKRTCTIRVVKPVMAADGAGGKTPVPKQTPVTSPLPSNTINPGSAGMNSVIPNQTGTPIVDSTVKPNYPGAMPVVPTTEPTDIPCNSAVPTKMPVMATSEPTKIPSGPIAPTMDPGISTTQPTTSPAPGYIPEDMELIPYFSVMEVQGEIMTVYLINKNYDGPIHVQVGGKEFAAEGNAKDALMLLAYGGTTKTDSTGRIRISRMTDADGMLEPYWSIEDLEQGMMYQMRAETRNTVKPAIANCGAIYFRGDVSSVIKIY